ncbi:MAG: VIT1/CCC1 transporter family protein [Thermomicrobiales bacterium]
MATGTPDQKRYRENLQAEIDGAALYRTLADVESSESLAEVYRRLAESEERHGAIWREKLADAGIDELPAEPGWRTRFLMALARRFGPSLILPTVTAHESADRNRYLGQAEAVEAGMPADERSHERLFRAISGSGVVGLEGPEVAQLEGRHFATGGNALRAAVLGANDGLVSNLSLVMGVAGASLSAKNILITGVAGLLAGSLSMAMGEWISVQSARELYEHQIGLEEQELETLPDEERDEMALIYEAKGLPKNRALELADTLMQDKTTALNTIVREELGVDPKELGGSPWTAAISSFILFSIGAIFPVLPYFVGGGNAAIVASIIFSAIALFAIGAGITIITGRNAFISGGRQVLFGLAAAAVTFGLGRLFDVAVG